MKRKRYEDMRQEKGQKVGWCRQCPASKKGDNPLRALYVRKPGAGFVRIGWYFEACGHVDIDEALIEDALAIRFKRELER